MYTLIDRFQAPGLAPDQRRRSRLLVGILLACLTANMFGALLTAIFAPNIFGFFSYISGTLVLFGALFLTRSGKVGVAAHGFVGFSFLILNTLVFLSDGPRSPVFALNASLVALAAMLLGNRFAGMYAVVAILLGVPFVLQPEWVAQFHILPDTPIGALTTQAMSLLYVLVLVGTLVTTLESALAEDTAKRFELDSALSRLHQTTVSREYVDNVIGAVNDMLLVTDAHHTIIDANPAAVKQLGLSRKELLGRGMNEILMETDLIGNATLAPTAARCRRSDGRALPVLASRGALPVHTGQVGGYVWAMSDHTVQHAAVEAVRRAHDTAESANQAKSQFLANMSHELRTPLNAIIGYSELLGEDPLSDAQQLDLSRIRGAGHHLLTLINGILDLSKVEAGKMELFLKDVQIPQLIGEVLDTIEAHGRNKGLDVVSEIGPGVGRARIDETKARQIVLNLLSNAIKFTEHGSVTLQTETWDREGMPWLRFQVSDTGIGMNAAQLETVFEPFSQAEKGTNRKYGGTGLGLSITRAFTRMMGGEIYVRSEPGAGTVFTVELPIGELDQLRTPGGHLRRAMPIPARPDETLILHIDDDPAVLELVQRILQSPTRRVVGTQDPEEGITWARTLNAHALLLDVQMPFVSGWNVLAQLQTDEHALPVVILTAEGEEAVARALGAAAFLRKPIDRPRLISTLERVISEDRDR